MYVIQQLPTGETVTLYVKEGIVHIMSIPYNTLVYVYSVDGEMLETCFLFLKSIQFKLHGTTRFSCFEYNL